MGVWLIPAPWELHERAAAAVAGSGPVTFSTDDLLPAGISVGRGWPTPDDLVGLGLFPNSWLVVTGEEGTQFVVGTCGAKGEPREGVVEIGYGLAPGFRGKGVGTAAVEQLLGQLRADPRVTLVVAEVAATNLASERLLRRVGFTVGDSPAAPQHRTWTLAV